MEESYGFIACSVVMSAESMKLADESIQISACIDDFTSRSMELSRFIDVFGRCSDVFGRCSMVKTHRTAARARSTTGG